MADEKSTQPITVALGEKRNATDIEVHELFTAVRAFLAEKGIEAGWTNFFWRTSPKRLSCGHYISFRTAGREWCLGRSRKVHRV